MVYGKLAGVAAETESKQQCNVYLPWGNEAEKVRAEQIADGLPFTIVCAKMNLLQAAYLLKHAVGIVGVDTGLLHLANALKTCGRHLYRYRSD